MSFRDTRLEDRTVSEALTALAAGPLTGWMTTQRWFGAKGRTVASITAADVATLDDGPPALALGFFDVRYEGADESDTDRYAVPLAVTLGRDALGSVGTAQTGGGLRAAVDDAGDDASVARILLVLAAVGARRATSAGGVIEGKCNAGMDPALGGQSPTALAVKRLGAEQSNTNYAVGGRLIVKLFRRLRAGTQPDVEVLEFLERAGFPNVPRVAGIVTHRDGSASGASTVIAIAQQFIPNRGDAWTTTRESLRAALEGGADVRKNAESMARLGEVTGAMHAALASDGEHPDFAPEPFGPADRDALASGVEARLALAIDALASLKSPLLGAAKRGAERVVSQRDAIVRAVREAAAAAPDGLARIRVHGDYHLGQVLATEGDDYVVIDFEGEPMRSMAERRAKVCGLKDVAGMLRSFSYASHTTAREVGGTASARAEEWETAARDAFLRGYLSRASGAPARLVPSEPAGLARLLALFELEKALYEVAYEVNHRPDWVAIPLVDIVRPLAALGL